jgi:hypothetical protein
MKLKLVRKQYAVALRAIGQDVADLFPARLEIEITGENFVARGQSKTGLSKNIERRMMWNIWHKLRRVAPKAQSSRVGFTRIYKPDDISRLEKTGIARRMDEAQAPDLCSLAERLRMIGAIADEENGELVRLCKDNNKLTCEYRDRGGNLHSEHYSTLTLYKLQQHHYSQRHFRLKDLWQRVMHCNYRR